MSNKKLAINLGLWMPFKTYLILLIISLLALIFLGIRFLNTMFSGEENARIAADKQQKEYFHDIVISEQEKQEIISWTKANNLNQYGDPLGTVYDVDLLYDVSTGEKINYYNFLYNKFPKKPWKQATNQ